MARLHSFCNISGMYYVHGGYTAEALNINRWLPEELL
jgi:hypothetical protein